MKKPTIIKKKDIQMLPIPFGGKEGDAGMWSMVIDSPAVDTKGVLFGTAEVNPGYAAHRWHTHTIDKIDAAGLEIVYSKNFEEFYYIVSGSGVCQWESKDGKIEEVTVTAGDVMFFPRGVMKHQLLNNGSEKIVMVWGGSPLNTIVKK